VRLLQALFRNDLSWRMGKTRLRLLRMWDLRKYHRLSVGKNSESKASGLVDTKYLLYIFNPSTEVVPASLCRTDFKMLCRGVSYLSLPVRPVGRSRPIFSSNRDFRRLQICAAAAEEVDEAEEELEEDVLDDVVPVKVKGEKKANAVPIRRKKRSKRYKSAVQDIMGRVEMSPMTAITMLKEKATAKFDETIEYHCRTSLDPRYADQQLRAAGNTTSNSFYWSLGQGYVCLQWPCPREQGRRSE